MHEKNVQIFKFGPSKNVDFPDDKSILFLSEEKEKFLSIVTPTQFPIIIKLVLYIAI